jgi:hypothetical protein
MAVGGSLSGIQVRWLHEWIYIGCQQAMQGLLAEP